ncbi:superoxide dismutase [uncultured Rikenella sp.]|uniref:superoxide dismutase n=1 Tax=uncultured Rikenella sp. TaxID=368003 RepID=UPI00261ADDE3|nr:superoxide dismutase [uncultured Rikenella sp.]
MKRHFLLSALLLLSTAILAVSAQNARKHELPKLPYALGALAPKMSQETLEYHYGKHYKAYIDNLNTLIQDTPYAGMSLEEIVVKAPNGPIFNNAGQSLNHQLFFLGMSPAPQSQPSGALAEAINKEFGSFDRFKAQFARAAAGIFGSGWAWLATDKAGNLRITTEANAGNPLRYGLIPLMGLDVWEHSYYIDYRNRRAEYITNYWDLVDWKVVGQRYDRR